MFGRSRTIAARKTDYHERQSDLPWEVTCRGVVDGIQMVVHMTRRDGRRFIEEALLVRGYNAEENLWLTNPIWPVETDKDREGAA